MKLQRKRLIMRLAAWVLIGCMGRQLPINVAAAEQEPPDTDYVLWYAPKTLTSAYEVRAPYLYVSPFRIRYSIQGRVTEDSGILYNLINTTKLTGTGTGAYGSIAAYSLTASSQKQENIAYRRINLEDNGHVSREISGKIRAVLLNSYPYIKDLRTVEEWANSWLESQGMAPVCGLQSGEAILAAQTAIWKLVHGDSFQISAFYSGMRNLQMDSRWQEKIAYPDITAQKPTEHTASNIESMCQYLFHLTPVKPLSPLVTGSSFENMACTYQKTNDGGYDVTVSFDLAASVGINDVLTLTAACGSQLQNIPVKTGGNYTVTFEGLPELEEVNLTVKGYQYGGDIYFFEPQSRDPEQALAGYDDSCLPAYGAITVSADQAVEVHAGA